MLRGLCSRRSGVKQAPNSITCKHTTPKSTTIRRKDANMVAGFSYKNIVTYLTIIIKWFMCLCYMLPYCTVVLYCMYGFLCAGVCCSKIDFVYAVYDGNSMLSPPVAYRVVVQFSMYGGLCRSQWRMGAVKLMELQTYVWMCRVQSSAKA